MIIYNPAANFHKQTIRYTIHSEPLVAAGRLASTLGLVGLLL